MATEITNATYDASTGSLVVTGSGFTSGGKIIVSRLTLRGQGNGSYLLTSDDVTASSSTTFSVTLNAADKLAMGGLLNLDGNAAVSGTPYNLSAAPGWDETANAAADTSGNPILVSGVAKPRLISATYDSATQLLMVYGTNLVAAPGTNNDITVPKLTLTGEGGIARALTSASVELIDATSFAVTLNAADRDAVAAMFNRNGTESSGGAAYRLSAADDWNTVIGNVDIADSTSSLTVSGVPLPVINSADYNASTGVLTVTGTGFPSAAGPNNDIVASKFTLTGEGGQTYTLASTANVDINSPTSFTLTLSDGDRAAIAQIINRAGTSSTNGTLYNLAASEDWAAGAPQSETVADLTGNGINVTNVPPPTITSATYDYASNTLTVIGTNLPTRAGSVPNDINPLKFTFTGEGGATYLLAATASVEIQNGTAFSIVIDPADQPSIERLLNHNDGASASGHTYNLAADEDWATGAAGSVNIADRTGNPINVVNWAGPTIAGATYDTATGVLVLTGTNFVNVTGGGNDIIANKLSFTGSGAPYTLTTTPNVDISGPTTATLTLSQADRQALEALMGKSGTAAGNGIAYNLEAADDWMAGSPKAAMIGDSTTPITVAAPPPTVTSATYNAGTGTLVVTGTFLQSQPGADNDIAVNKLTLAGEGGMSYTLTTGHVDATSTKEFTVVLNAADRAAVNLFMNGDGKASTGGTTYNLSVADDWNAAAPGGDSADATNPVTVSGVAAPTITSATYDTSSGTLVVTGTGLLSRAGQSNDIDVSKLWLFGESGRSVGLASSTDVDVTSATSFTVVLSTADRAAVDAIVNRNGTAAAGGAGYQIVADEDWAAGAAASVNVADTKDNTLTVSGTEGAGGPKITSATYDAATGVLVVTGTGLIAKSGTANDVVASKFGITGQGGATHMLVDTSNADITSNTSFTLKLGLADRQALSQIINRNGSASADATSYNLIAAEDWATGVDPAMAIADLTGNGIMVSGVPVPSVTSAIYNGDTGVLTVYGSGFLSVSGANNDIDLSKISITGQGSSPHTLTGQVDIVSGAQFTVTLGPTERAALNLVLNKGGDKSLDGKAYNLAASDGWAVGAGAATDESDLSGNRITVSYGVDRPVGSTIDGAIVSTVTLPLAGGGQEVTVAVAPVPAGRADDPATQNRHLADVTLAQSGNAPLLSIGLPTNVGAMATGVVGSSKSLRQRLVDAIDNVATAPALTHFVQAGVNAYLPLVHSEAAVLAGSLTLNVPAGTAVVPETIVITGGAGRGEGDTAQPLREEALAIDARDLPARSVLQLDRVEFAAVSGNVRVVGGLGNNIVLGDDEAQTFVLGPGNDLARGGGGNDILAGSDGHDRLCGDADDDMLFGGAGNDLLEGGSGNDVLQGGCSDAGTWTFFVDGAGLLTCTFSAQDAAFTDAPSLAYAGPWTKPNGQSLPLSDDRIAFAGHAIDRLKTVALLHQAVMDRLPTLDEFNFYVTLPLTEVQLAAAAHAYFEQQTHATSKPIESQVRSLIETVWGPGGDAEGLVPTGTTFIAGGGSWAQALLYLAMAKPSVDKLRDEQGRLPLTSAWLGSELGWQTDSGSDVLLGGDGNDRLVGGGGADMLDGGNGIDMAVFTGSIGDYRFSIDVSGAQRTVALKSTDGSGTDTLVSIELLQIGSAYYRFDDLSALAKGVSYALSDHAHAMTLAEVQVVGIPGL